MSKGLLIAYEGPEGSGKTTQVAGLVEHLRQTQPGRRVVRTREPGATPIGERIRELLLDPTVDMPAKTEALLYAADRAAHVFTLVQPALNRGDIVVTDRYIDSSIAYQGMGRAIGADVVELALWATGGLYPRLTVLLDIDPAIGLARAGNRSHPDRLEAEPLDFHERVRAGFLQLARSAPGRYLILDADQPAAALTKAAAERVDALLAPAAAGDR